MFPTPNDLINHLSDRYLNFTLIEKGGMSNVYKALDMHLGRHVAIKIINRSKISEEALAEYSERFEQEAKLLAQLSHANLIRVWDYGVFEGVPYLIMEYCSKGTLADKMSEMIPWEIAFDIIRPIAKGLAYAHSRNIIHRDIKPSNIMFSDDGEIVLGDFGVAKSLQVLRSFATKTGTIVGTPMYMSPEQARGKEADVRSDIYSFGVVLYKMITAHIPYNVEEDDAWGILIAKNKEAPTPPRLYVPDLPERVRRVLMKMLELDPDERYQSMQELLLDLEMIGGDRSDSSAMENSAEYLIANSRHVELETNVDINKDDKNNEADSFLGGNGEGKDDESGKGANIKGTQAGERQSVWQSWSFRFPVVIFVLIALLGLFTFPRWKGWVLSNPTEVPAEAMTEVSAEVATEAPTDAATEVPTDTATETPTEAPTESLEPLPATITSPSGTTMHLILSGEFFMGSNADAHPDESPSGNIYVDNFYIDEYEITNEQYQLCVSSDVCLPPQRDGSRTRSSYYSAVEFSDYPVIYVTWDMAKTYCEWRGGRLPTEAEWEKAARGLDAWTYPWGESVDCDLANYGDGSCEEDTVSVGSYPDGQSVYSLYDMSGNVAEWVSSLYQPYPYDPDDGREDLESEGVRVIRGGSWDILDGDVRVTNRNGFVNDAATDWIGFRCAQSP